MVFWNDGKGGEKDIAVSLEKLFRTIRNKMMVFSKSKISTETKYYFF